MREAKKAGVSPREAAADVTDDDLSLPTARSALVEIVSAFAENKLAVIGAILVIAIVFIAVAAPLVAPYDPYKIDLDAQFLAQSPAHPVGTDMFGRDVLSRIIYGARISLLVGLVPTSISMLIGIVMGLVSGYFGRRVDFVIMMIADMVLSFPSLLLAMIVMYTLGASLLNIFIALSVVGWAGTARVVRSQTLSIKHKEFVEASRAIGTSSISIMWKQILRYCRRRA